MILVFGGCIDKLCSSYQNLVESCYIHCGEQYNVVLFDRGSMHAAASFCFEFRASD